MEEPTHPREKKRAGRASALLVALAVAGVVFVADQAIKSFVEGSMRLGESIPVVPGFFSITHIQNEGGAFGILGGSQTILLVGSLVAVGAVLWMLLSGAPSRLTTLGCGLVLGGAAGNLLDRLTAGAVTDYIHFSFWYVFNAADIGITVGVALLLLASLRGPARG